MVGVDPENLDIQFLEFVVIGLPGRQIRHSSRSEIDTIKLKEDQLFSPELAQTDSLSRRAGQREVRRLFPDLQGRGPTGAHQHTNQQYAQYHQTARSLRDHTSLLSSKDNASPTSTTCAISVLPPCCSR